MRPIVNIYRLGRASYVKALNIQNVLFDNLKRIVTSPDVHTRASIEKSIRHLGISSRINRLIDNDRDVNLVKQYPVQIGKLPVTNSLILVEHEPVYTVGLRAQSYNQDYVAKLKAKLAESNLHADFVVTNRGGLITFHGPGQLVAYPILYLGDFPSTIPNKSVKAYVKVLEDTIIDTLTRVGVAGAHTVREYPGVWLANGQRKVAFVGITCKRYVTMHGISINCDCELSWFDHIVSCGIEDKLITSIQREYMSINKPLTTSSSGGEVDHIPYEQDGATRCLEDNTCQIRNKPTPHRDSINSGPLYSVQNIANAFCSSFSHHFDCELLEG